MKERLEEIQEKLNNHKAKYPTFDVERFSGWYLDKAQDDKWYNSHKGFSVVQLNKVRQIQKDVIALMNDVNSCLKAIADRVDSI